MDGFTGLQRFFLSYASIWRTKNRDELAEQYLQIDPHSPAEFRTNGIASNVDLFYDAFGVTEGDAMWLANTAVFHDVWLALRIRNHWDWKIRRNRRRRFVGPRAVVDWCRRPVAT